MKILAFPKSSNPYSELLYSQIRKMGDKVSYVRFISKHQSINIVTIIPQIIFWRILGYKVFHIHWVTSFSIIGKSAILKAASRVAYAHYIFCLKLIKLIGYKLVWTGHNVLPHEQAFQDDLLARKKLVESCDLVIGHSQKTINRLQELGIKPKNFSIIPIGSYSGIYPDGISKIEARKILKIGSNAFTYLNLGLIRKYKGIEDLLEAYKKIGDNDTQLIIAGECSDLGIKDKIKESKLSQKIIWHDGHVPDSDLQTYFAAADVVVLPFKAITTSSSSLLAFSFGKTIIVSNVGDMTDLPDDMVYKYENGDINNLISKMLEVKNNPTDLKDRSEKVKTYADKLNWSSIAERTHSAMESLF